MTPLTHQQMFDKALFGIRAQGRFSTTTPGACNYRTFGYNGEVLAKCGVGHLIPDNAYNPAFDNPPSEGPATVGLSDVNTLIRTQPDFVQALKDGGVDVDTPLLKDLQEAHDGASSRVRDVGFDKAMKDFEKRMRGLAIGYDLVYTKP